MAVADSVRRACAPRNGSSVKNTMPALELALKPLMATGRRTATAPSTPGLLQADLGRLLADHRFGPVERRGDREAARRRPGTACPASGRSRCGTVLKPSTVRHQQAAIDEQRDAAAAHEPCTRALSRRCRCWSKTRLKRRKNQPSARPCMRDKRSFCAPMRLQQQRGQRRAKRQRVERRDHRRDGDGQRELPVELAGEAADERDRHEHRAQHQRRWR